MKTSKRLNETLNAYVANRTQLEQLGSTKQRRIVLTGVTGRNVVAKCLATGIEIVLKKDTVRRAYRPVESTEKTTANESAPERVEAEPKEAEEFDPLKEIDRRLDVGAKTLGIKPDVKMRELFMLRVLRAGLLALDGLVKS